MRKFLALALVAAAPLMADGNTATDTATAAVTIFAPVTLKASGTLDFGKVVITDTTLPATVTLDKNAAATYTNAAAFSGAAKVNAAVPTFNGTKDANLEVKFTINATIADGTIALDPVANIVTGTTFSFPITGKLSIPAGQLGTKAGLVTVTADYI